jgi:glycerophosphoryl diester phosphodiesterase
VPREAPAPEVVAHRGATAEAPEHTLAAYRHAAEIGADAVECDVRLTRDGVLVCVHDRRVSRTSNGHGVVSALRLAELEQFHFGARRTRRNRWLVDYVTATPGRVRLAIETKHPTRHTRKVEEALVVSLRRFGLVRNGGPLLWEGRPALRMMSFSALAVRRMQDMVPGMPTVQLIGKRLRPVRDEVLLGPASAVGPGVALIRADPDYVARAHEAGKEVHVWTVNRARDVELMTSLGVDAIITDFPDDVMRSLGRGAPPTPVSA